MADDTNTAISPKSWDPQTDTNRAAPEVQSVEAVRDAEAKAVEAAAKAADANKTKEQRAADKARADADDARAQAAADLAENNAIPDRMSVGEAKLLVPVDPEMGAGDHFAQSFTNTPENPKIFKGEHADPEKATVKLSMIVPDHPLGVRTTVCHPDLRGDYARAGWDVELP